MRESATKQSIYKWNGTDREGAPMQGKMLGATQPLVKAKLRRQGINPNRVRKQTNLFGLGGGKRKKKIKPVDIALFARQFSTMLTSGVALVQALEVIAKGNKNPAMTALVNDIRHHIESGSTLSEALERHPEYYDDLFVNLIAAGETSGTLDTLLDKIATHKEKTVAIKAKARKALYYPSAILVTAFIVMVILLYFVVPQFQSLFDDYDAELPVFTQIVIGTSEIFQQWWWAGFIGIVVTIFALKRAHTRSYRFRRAVDRCLINLPIIGNILYKSIVARFARTLSTLFAAGVPLVEALDSVGKVAGNIIFTEGIRQIRTQVAAGQRLQVALAHTGLFPGMAEQMIAIGEESGSLDVMCTRVADIYEEEVDNQVEALSSLLEPLVMVVIGVLVGGLVIAMYLPVFRLGSAI